MAYTKEARTQSTRPRAAQMKELREHVRALRAKAQTLETERDQLREENQSLRRELTHIQLMEDLRTTLADEAPTEDEEALSTTTVRRLYRALPTPCTFGEFFRMAEREDMSGTESRRCLRHFLGNGLLVHEGGQVKKPASGSEEEG